MKGDLTFTMDGVEDVTVQGDIGAKIDEIIEWIKVYNANNTPHPFDEAMKVVEKR